MSASPQPPFERQVLLTGASGLLGSEVARRFLVSESVAKLWLPLRVSRSGESVALRAERLFQEWEQSGSRVDRERVCVFEVRWDDPQLGLLDSDVLSLKTGLTDVVHAAASVALDGSLEECSAANLHPTQALLGLLQAENLCSRVRFHQVSTYAVTRAEADTDRVLETARAITAREARNFYEQTKAEAERAVLHVSEKSGLWCRLYRTSILVGDSRTGWTSKFDGIYSILRLFLSAQDLGVSRLPVFSDARLEALTIDSVAEALVTLVLSANGASREARHLTAGEQAPLLIDVLSQGANWVRAQGLGWQLPAFELISENVPDRVEFCLSWLENQLGVPRDALPQALSILLPYATQGTVFDRRLTEAELRAERVELLSLGEVLPEILSYAVRSDWGATAEPRPPLLGKETEDPIVISAVGFRLPGASSLDEFQRILESGECQLREIPRERWNPDVYLKKSLDDPEEEGSACQLAGVVDLSDFEPSQFRITPRAAESMDRLQKMVLLSARDLLKDVAASGEGLTGVDPSRVACVLGHSGVYLENDYRFGIRVARNLFVERFEREVGTIPPALVLKIDRELRGETPPISEDALPGSLANVAAGRVMNSFDFHGPSWVVGAGSSSGLAALEQASDLLRNGESDFVLAGGGHAILDPLLYVTLSAEAALSSSVPAPWTSDASGSVPGEGVVLFGLSRRSFAKARGLRIYAELAGIGRASSGKGRAITTPSPEGIRQAWERTQSRTLRRNDLRGSGTGFGLELHGSAIPQEDSAEAAFVRAAFLGEELEHIGVQKPLFGHLMGASSALSVLKALASLSGGKWQGECVRSRLGFEKLQRAGSDQKPLSVGVVSFGFAGPTYTALLQKDSSGALKESPPARARRVKRTSDPIAIVSIGATLPGARRSKEFSRLLRRAEPQFRPMPKPLWENQKSSFYSAALDSTEDRTHSELGSFVEPVSPQELLQFSRWGIPPETLARMDPNHHHFFRAAAEVLEDDSWRRPPNSTRFGASVGESSSSMRGAWWLGKRLSYRSFRYVLEGAREEVAPHFSEREWSRLWQEFEQEVLRDVPSINEDSGPGALLPFSLARLCKALDLRGGHWISDAACASSLSALAVAVRELRLRRLDAVLWGGVGMSVGPLCNIFFSRCQALSQRGSFPFDETADGIVLGEGSVVAVLKRLADAEREGDRILGVLEGIAGASDGRGTAIMAPSVPGQVRAMRAALKDAGVEPHQVDFVECHATGTAVGDPIELAALSEAYETSTRNRVLKVGASKGIVGHTVGAAGAVGVLKVVSCFQEREWTPQPIRTRENAALQLQERKLARVEKTESWGGQPPGMELRPHRAGVSSFGFGGTNWHALFREPSRRNLERKSVRTVSARNRGVRAARPLIPVFCFPGHGSPYPQMGRPYYESSAAFRALIEEANPELRRWLGQSFEELVYQGCDEEIEKTLFKTEYVQPLLLVANLAFYRMVRSQGLRPGIVLGHSVGEFSAAVAAGILSLSDAIAVTYERGRIYRHAKQTSGADLGAMLALRSSEKDVREWLAEVAASGLGVAAINSPSQTVVSGPYESIFSFKEKMEGRGIQARTLSVEVAWHSDLAGELGAIALRTALSRVNWRLNRQFPGIPLIRCSGAELVSASAAGNQESLVEGFVRQLSEPIDFRRMLARASEECEILGGAPAFLEVGPSSILSHLAQEGLLSEVWVDSVDFPKGMSSRSAFQLPSGLSRALEELPRGMR